MTKSILLVAKEAFEAQAIARASQTVASHAVSVANVAIAQRDYAYEHSSYEPK